MDIKTGRPDHIEDILITLHTGQWFGWLDYKNKIYENLIIADPEKVSPENRVLWGSWSTDKPEEKSLTDALAKAQSDFDSQEYARKRQGQEGYPSVGDQLDMLMKDMRDRTETHQTACEAVKLKYPKPE